MRGRPRNTNRGTSCWTNTALSRCTGEVVNLWLLAVLKQFAVPIGCPILAYLTSSVVGLKRKSRRAEAEVTGQLHT